MVPPCFVWPSSFVFAQDAIRLPSVVEGSGRFAGAVPSSHNPRLAGEWSTTPALAC